MSGRQVVGGLLLAAVFFGFYVAFGLTGGWLFATAGFGGGMVLGVVVIYAVRLLVDATP